MGIKPLDFKRNTSHASPGVSGSGGPGGPGVDALAAATAAAAFLSPPKQKQQFLSVSSRPVKSPRSPRSPRSVSPQKSIHSPIPNTNNSKPIQNKNNKDNKVGESNLDITTDLKLGNTNHQHAPTKRHTNNSKDSLLKDESVQQSSTTSSISLKKRTKLGSAISSVNNSLATDQEIEEQRRKESLAAALKSFKISSNNNVSNPRDSIQSQSQSHSDAESISNLHKKRLSVSSLRQTNKSTPQQIPESAPPAQEFEKEKDLVSIKKGKSNSSLYLDINPQNSNTSSSSSILSYPNSLQLTSESQVPSLSQAQSQPLPGPRLSSSSSSTSSAKLKPKSNALLKSQVPSLTPDEEKKPNSVRRKPPAAPQTQSESQIQTQPKPKPQSRSESQPPTVVINDDNKNGCTSPKSRPTPQQLLSSDTLKKPIRRHPSLNPRNKSNVSASDACSLSSVTTTSSTSSSFSKSLNKRPNSTYSYSNILEVNSIDSDLIKDDYEVDDYFSLSRSLNQSPVQPQSQSQLQLQGFVKNTFGNNNNLIKPSTSITNQYIGIGPPTDELATLAMQLGSRIEPKSKHQLSSNLKNGTKKVLRDLKLIPQKSKKNSSIDNLVINNINGNNLSMMYDDQFYDSNSLSNDNNITTVQLKSTMRKQKKKEKDFNEDKPWKHHTDTTRLTEQERKRYEGVWASNKCAIDSRFLYIENNYNNTCDESIHALVVRELWRRSKLPEDILRRIWDLVDLKQDRTLNRESFLVGMWLVDQCLYGRKLPKAVDKVVWDSVTRLNVEVNILKKTKR